MRVSRVWIVAACCSIGWPSAAADYQPTSKGSILTIEGRSLSLRGDERTAIDTLDTAARGTSWREQDRALREARSVATSPDARYAVGFYQLYISRLQRNSALRAQALDLLIGSESTPRTDLKTYLGEGGQFAFKAGDFAKASVLWTRALDLQPRNADAMVNLAQARLGVGDARGAADLIRKAIDVRGGSGPIPESWLRQWLSITYNGKLTEGIAAAHALVDAYPTSDNWRIALVGYRQLATPEGDAEIDLFRLMQKVGVLARSNEYNRFAQLLLRAGSAVEAKAVLDEGLQRGIVKGTESPTPEILKEIERSIAQGDGRILPAHGAERAAFKISPSTPADRLLAQQHYARSIEAYRSALEQGGENMALRLRLATALLQDGRRAEAEAAFQAVAGTASADAVSGPYSNLARFWLSWMRQADAGKTVAVRR